jgi:hypothetical protein
MTTLALLLALSTGQIPTGIPQQPTTNFPSPTAYPQHLLKDSTRQCMAYSRVRDGLPGWACFVEEGETTARTNGLRSLSSPPASPSPGDTYSDTTKGCLQTWSGSAWTPATCPPTTVPPSPQPPNTLLNPAATAPSGSFPVGASFYDTSQRCVRSTNNGTAFDDCPVNSTGAAMPQSGSPPALPPGQATSNRGRVYFDTAQSCTRATRDGLNWGPCLTTEVCTTANVTGLSIPLAGISTAATLTLAGATPGRPCRASYPTYMPLNASAVCRVTAANTVEYRFQSNSGLLSGVLAVPNGAYAFCTEVIW